MSTDLNPSSDRPIVNQCTAHRRNGDQCRRSAIKGSHVCSTHGGSAPQVQRAAQVRLLMASDTVAGELVKIALSKKASDAVRISAILAVLDRAGISARQQITIEASVETWESRADAAVVDWGELENMPDRYGNPRSAEAVDWYADNAPEDATLDASQRPDPHLELRRAEVEAESSRVRPQPEETPPWVSPESGAQTARRLADEHRRSAFAADKASKGLSPLRRRKR